ncbi:MAG: type II secretion system major pseudopilin GspG [Limisphaerales bacterium]
MKLHTSLSPRSHGFTLVELLLVLVILGILAAIVVPHYGGKVEMAKVMAAKAQIATFKGALSAYEIDMGSYPKSGDGLRALIEQPNDAQGWKGPYMDVDEVPVDPWKHAYAYVCPGVKHPVTYDLASAGPDGREGTDDDIAK